MIDLTAIENRIAADRDDYAEGYTDQSIRDREALVALVQSQEETLTALLDLANVSGRRGWRINADDIRAVLGTAA